jgi:CRISPR-associated protein Csd1
LNGKQDYNLVFSLRGERLFIHDRPAAKLLWDEKIQRLESEYNKFGDKKQAQIATGVDLVTGMKGQIARVHRKIGGLGNPTGNAVVSFNDEAYLSYGKKQSANAPISIASAFEYTTALNDLLDYSSGHRVTVADTVAVFWAARQSPVEGFLGFVLNPQKDDSANAELRLYLEAIHEGKQPRDVDPAVQFNVLGLAPNVARLSIRFWYSGTVGEIGERIGRHFRDICIEKQYKDKEPDYPPLWRLLLETAVQHKSENIPPLLAGSVMRSLLTGAKYPESLLAQVIARIRAEHDVNYYRASLIKGCLTRNHSREVCMSLDKDNKTPAYLLGRVFALLEKVQKDAIPGANTTIKDRYYSSASATPRSVFPILLRGAQHHIPKAPYGKHTEGQIEEVMQDVKEFPAHLNLEDQGFFAIGYYHQRNANYQKKDK